MTQSDVFDDTNREVIDSSDTVYDLTVLHEGIEGGGEKVTKDDIKKEVALGVFDEEESQKYLNRKREGIDKLPDEEKLLFDLMERYRAVCLEVAYNKIIGNDETLGGYILRKRNPQTYVVKITDAADLYSAACGFVATSQDLSASPYLSAVYTRGHDAILEFTRNFTMDVFKEQQNIPTTTD